MSSIVSYTSRCWPLLACLFLLNGCVSAPKPTRPKAIPKVIWYVDFKGNSKLSASTLQKAIETAPTPMFTRITRLRATGQFTVYNKAIVRADIQRLQKAYRYYGFYRAKIEEAPESPIILTQKNGYRPYQRVRVIFKVQEGPQAELVSDAEIVWQLGRLPQEYVERKLKQYKFWNGRGKAPSLAGKVEWRRKIEEGFKQEILKGLKVKKGESFSTPDYQGLKSAIVQRLQDSSFALAEFNGEIEVEKDAELAPLPKKTKAKKPVKTAKTTVPKSKQVPSSAVRKGTAVKMKLIINSGPSCRFGQISLRPLPLMVDGRAQPPRVDYKALRNYIKFKKGDIYKIQTLIQTQRTLSGLGLFSSVDFKPDITGVRSRQKLLRRQIRQAREIRVQKTEKQKKNKTQLTEISQEKQAWANRFSEQKARLETSYRAFQVARARLEKQTPPPISSPTAQELPAQLQEVTQLAQKARKELQDHRQKRKQQNARGTIPLQDEMLDLYNDINAIQLTQKKLETLITQETQLQKESGLLDKEFQTAITLEEQSFRELGKQVNIPITLELREDRPGLGKFGGGIVIDGQRNQIEVSGAITLLNVGQLGRLEFQLRPGWSFLPDIFRRIDMGPDFTGSASFVQPFFSGDRQGDFRVRLLGSYTQQIGDADFWRIVPSVSVSYPLLVSPTLGTIQGTISLNGEVANVQNVLLPRERETYAFAYLEQQITWSWLNDPIRRIRGVEFKLTLQQALGSYAYIKVAPEISLYIPLFSLGADKVVFAARLQYGALFSTRLIGATPPNFGSTAEDKHTAEIVYRSPLTQRFYLGGANSVRGWTARYLGPLACQKSFQSSNPNYIESPSGNGGTGITDYRIRTGDAITFSGAGSTTGGIGCREQTGRNALDRFRDMSHYRDSLPQDGRRGDYYPVEDSIVQVIPMGGEQQIYGSLELRIPLSILVSSLGFVLFADVGVVQLERRFWDETINAPPADLIPSWSLGFGIRYHTVIGAIRLDIAWRLFPDADRYPLQRDWQFHFSIGEAF
ncbi:MAG: BamA/TamA family outer membrane protein [Myxococcales bacterium]|nr:BamA/TamA family outer membrane protein [Myxococcales bacterium]